ncbi:MAG: ferritin [Planctomycetes bacterium]|nr:ferritin [Planctomycetota bacterium]
MMNEKVLAEFNNQIKEEMFSAHLYRSMAAWFESLNLRGYAKWMRVQAGEEDAHAAKFFDFIIERGGRVALQQINQPPHSWNSPLEAFGAGQGHEEHITRRINFLVDLARAEKDNAAENFLQWFVAEQVEEEANAAEIVGKLRMIGNSAGGLLVLDHHLGKRGEKD